MPGVRMRPRTGHCVTVGHTAHVSGVTTWGGMRLICGLDAGLLAC